MTAVEALRALARRWYILTLALALTVGGVVLSWPGQPVYSARESVLFVWPGSIPLSRTEDGGLGALVNFAALVRRALPADEGRSLASASFGGTLAGAGVRSGYTVELPNSGGQWTSSYDQPRLVVEAVGASRQEALELLQMVRSNANEVTASLQTRLGVPQASQITASWTDPAEVSVTSSTSTTRLRGSVALGVFGCMSTVLCIVGLERVRIRKPGRTELLSQEGG